jgi:hypothetical protein
MKCIRVFAPFLGMALVLGFSLWLLVEKGNALLFLAALAAFVIAFGKIGCSSH